MHRVTLVYLGPVGWHTIRQRPQHLAAGLAQSFDVHYAGPVGLRSLRWNDWQRLMRREPRRAAPAANDAPPVYLHQPRYLPWTGSLACALNSRWLARQVRSWLPGNDAPWILWCSTPSILAEAARASCAPTLTVYDCMDRYAAFHRGVDRTRIETREARLAAHADVVFASSPQLVEHLRQFRESVDLLPNGVDLEHFRPADYDFPAALRGLPRPLIGYYGTLGDWLDYDLLKRLAAARPQWSWALFGPQHSARVRELAALPNVHVLPAVAYADLPAYAQQFSAAIVPFCLNELTVHVHPLKALEYLALGLPVVASPLPDLMPLRGALELAAGAEAWLAALDNAVLHTPTASARQSRRAAVADSSWSARLEQVQGRLQRALSDGSARLAPRQAA